MKLTKWIIVYAVAVFGDDIWWTLSGGVAFILHDYWFEERKR